MSEKNKPRKKTVVVTTEQESAQKESGRKQRIKPTVSRARTPEKAASGDRELTFSWDNYKFMLIGAGLIALGMVLMLGGSMPSPDVWDESLIYSFRRTVLAPVVILLGFGMEVYAIFRNYR